MGCGYTQLQELSCILDIAWLYFPFYQKTETTTVSTYWDQTAKKNMMKAATEEIDKINHTKSVA